MKKLIYALLISLVVLTAPSFAASNWKYVATDSYGDKWYIDLNSINITGVTDIEASAYTVKIVPGGAGKKAFDNYYGQPVASIIDEWLHMSRVKYAGKRKVYGTNGKLIKLLNECPSFYGNSESSKDAFASELDDSQVSIVSDLTNIVGDICTANKMEEKLYRLQKKHKGKYVTVYSTGKVEVGK